MFTKFCATVSKLCLVLAVIGLIAVILCVQWQVIGRYILNDTPTWAEALALVLEGKRFDLILCDLMMPVMTGMDLHAELLIVAPDQAARMVFMTGGVFNLQGALCFVTRSGYTGEDGFELYIPATDAAALWQAATVAGETRGLQACGLALSSNWRYVSQG